MVRETDYIQQLANYIKKNLTKGYTIDSLKFSLLNQGYSRTAINRAIDLANKQLAEKAPKMVEKPSIKVETEPLVEIPRKSFWERIKKLFS